MSTVETIGQGISRKGEGRERAAPLQVAGRTLPQSEEAEAGLLACCLLDDSDVVARYQEQKMTAEAFHNPGHRMIYESICRVYV